MGVWCGIYENKRQKTGLLIFVGTRDSRFGGPFPSLRASGLRSLIFLVFDRDHSQAVASSFEAHGLPLRPRCCF